MKRSVLITGIVFLILGGALLAATSNSAIAQTDVTEPTINAAETTVANAEATVSAQGQLINAQRIQIAELTGRQGNGPTATPDSSTNQVLEPSGPGGIGNTRENVFAAWGISSSTEPVLDFNALGIQDVTYNTSDGSYQLSFVFRLEPDNQIRRSDRLIQLVIDVSTSPMSESSALAFADQFIPSDVREIEPRQPNRFNEPTWRYFSDDIAALFHDLEMEGEQVPDPGTIFVTMFPGGDEVLVIDIALFDPSEF